MPQFAARTDAVPFDELFGLAAVKIQKAHGQRRTLVSDGDDQLTTRTKLDIAVRHHTFHLHRRSAHKTGRGDAGDLGFVLVAHGQMQHQFHVRAQSEARQFVFHLHRAGRGRLLGGGSFLR